ncbi:unnamed protein product [Symbiodinium necroappetens]|uniref:BON domain-containing protein n=1 Tax=Symbiodinium necroappetens TaxID=1628268 RepID=A0A813BK68_9DINO|nr:unnamed protein product [Symbiodinium necroappetens]
MTRSIFILLGLVTALALPVASAQDAPPPEASAEQEAPADPEALTATDRVIDVSEAPRDEDIAARISSTLEATDQFTGLTVRASSGVVTLRGTAATQNAKDLATKLAERTDGVAAVMNNLAIDKGPVWTLAPAQREIESISRATVRALPLIGIGLIVLAVSFLLARLISSLAVRTIFDKDDSALLRNVVRKLIAIVIGLIGIYLFLRISGLTRVALTVVSGTGILGLVLGFAFRDIAENFLASLLLSVQRPFRMGDVIEVDGHTGVVRKVTTRGTLLIDFDGNHIQIANSTVYKNTIKNFTANPKVRGSFSVGIGYEDDIATAQQVIRDMLEKHPAVLEDPEPLILVTELGAATVNLKVYFWLNGHEHSVLKVTSSVIRLAAGALTREGITMPDEAREVIFPQGVPVTISKDGDSPRPAASSHAPASAEPKPRPTHDDDTVATEAEGDLSPETKDLEKQADASRDPDEGANVLEEQ